MCACCLLIPVPTSIGFRGAIAADAKFPRLNITLIKHHPDQKRALSIDKALSGDIDYVAHPSLDEPSRSGAND